MEYTYSGTDPTWDDEYLFRELIETLSENNLGQTRIFKIGCGNGYLARRLSDIGYDVTGIDISKSGIAEANRAYPNIKLYQEDLNTDLSAKYGKFPVVISLDVIEHVFSPSQFMETFTRLLEPGGLGFISTPYHGYTKNLAIVLAGKFDSHFSPLWEGGHIKFFSRNTLTKLLDRFSDITYEVRRIGRIPPLAKSLVAVIRR